MIIEPKREILIGPLVRIGMTRAWAARDHFIRLAVLPVIGLLLIAGPSRDALVAAQVSAATAGGGTELDPASGGDPTVLLQAGLLALCSGAILAVFALNWIRVLTLGPKSVPGLGQALGMRHLRFFLLIFGLTVAVMVPTMIAATLMMILLGSQIVGVMSALMLGMLVWAAMLARLSPSWIGLAIDARMPLSTAWRRTAGQGFKLLLALILVEVLTMLVQQFVSGILAFTGVLGFAPYASLMVVAVLGLAGLALQVAMMVSAFPHFLRETV